MQGVARRPWSGSRSARSGSPPPRRGREGSRGAEGAGDGDAARILERGAQADRRRARGAAAEAEAKLAAAEPGRDRAERSFEELQRGARRRSARSSSPRRDAAPARRPRRRVAEATRRVEAEVDRRVEEARRAIQAEADRRVAAAEQRAAEAEAAAAEAHETAIRLETEIERRVMEGTEEVRREAEESVRKLVEKVEREAEEAARARAEDQMQAESERISGPVPAARGARPRGDRERDPGQRQQGPARGAGGGRGVGADLAAQRVAGAVARPATGPSSATTSLRLAMREVRIRDTLSGELRTLDPDRRGRHLRLRPDRLQPHPHRQRPPLRRLLAVRPLPALGGLPARLVINVTDINDKIYAAAGAGGRALGGVRRADDRRLLRGHRPARPRPARRRAAGDRDDRRHRRPDRRAGRVRPRLRVRRRRLLPRPQLRRLRQALQPPPRGHGPGRGGGLGLAEGGAARLRPLEGAQGGGGHQLGLALGPGAARPGTSSAR